MNPSYPAQSYLAQKLVQETYSQAKSVNEQP